MIRTRREHGQVLYDLLKVIDSRVRIKRTHILYKANFSHEMLMENLSYLLKKECIIMEQVKHSYYYSITDKGIKMLGLLIKSRELYNEAMSL